MRNKKKKEVRGGSWTDYSWHCHPGFGVRLDGSDRDMGFRVFMCPQKDKVQ